MVNSITRKPKTLYILITLIIFQGISGIIGGTGLILDPSGRILNIPVEWLNNSPFTNYFVPGLVLLTILGILPLIVAYGLMSNVKSSWYGSLLMGISLNIWIAVEIITIGYHTKPPLQLIYGSGFAAPRL